MITIQILFIFASTTHPRLWHEHSIVSYATEYDQVYFTGVILSPLASTIPSFWTVLRLNSNYVHKPCIYKNKKPTKKKVPKCVQLLNLVSLDDVHVCARRQNVWLSALVQFVSASATLLHLFLPMFGETVATFSMLHLWVLSVLVLTDRWVLLATPVFNPRLFTYLSWSPTCMLNNFQTRTWTRCGRHTVVCELLCNGLP